MFAAQRIPAGPAPPRKRNPAPPSHHDFHTSIPSLSVSSRAPQKPATPAESALPQNTAHHFANPIESTPFFQFSPNFAKLASVTLASTTFTNRAPCKPIRMNTSARHHQAPKRASIITSSYKTTYAKTSNAWSYHLTHDSARYSRRRHFPNSLLPYLLTSHLQSSFFQHRRDLRILHEHLPHQPAAVILDHYRDRRLVQSHVDRRDPILLCVERVARAVNVPEPRAILAIKVLQRRQRSFRRVGKGSQRTRRRHDAAVIVRVRRAGVVALRTVRRRQSPGIRTVPFEMFRIRDAVRQIDARCVAIILKIIREAIRGRVGIESQEGIVLEKERLQVCPSHIQFNSEILFPVGVAIPRRRIVRARTYRRMHLIGPPRVIQIRRNRMRW